jgi:hypothetical protein
VVEPEGCGVHEQGRDGLDASYREFNIALCVCYFGAGSKDNIGKTVLLLFLWQNLRCWMKNNQEEEDAVFTNKRKK